MAEKEAWAIRDVRALGRWYVAMGSPWSDETKATHFTSYAGAAAVVCDLGDYVRIVPAPPREMTDAECWEWFQGQSELAVISYHPNKWTIWDRSGAGGNGDWHTSHKNGVASPCDAIRAARRALSKQGTDSHE